MSWQATLWAANLPHSRVGHVPFRVLMLLADHAHDDGTASWRSVGSMAATLEVSERTIKRALADLKMERLIEPGDQRLTMHLPTNKRPTVYNLLMTRPVAIEVELFTGVTDLSPVTSVVQPSKEEPPLTTSKTSRGNHTGDVTPGRVHVTHLADSGRPCLAEMVTERHCLYGHIVFPEAVEV